MKHSNLVPEEVSIDMAIEAPDSAAKKQQSLELLVQVPDGEPPSLQLGNIVMSEGAAVELTEVPIDRSLEAPFEVFEAPAEAHGDVPAEMLAEVSVPVQPEVPVTVHEEALLEEPVPAAVHLCDGLGIPQAVPLSTMEQQGREGQAASEEKQILMFEVGRQQEASAARATHVAATCLRNLRRKSFSNRRPRQTPSKPNLRDLIASRSAEEAAVRAKANELSALRWRA